MYFGQQYFITIKGIFDWSVKDGWGMFWDQGKRHYHEEMVFYELLTQLDNQNDGGASVNTRTAVEDIPPVPTSSSLIDLT